MHIVSIWLHDLYKIVFLSIILLIEIIYTYINHSFDNQSKHLIRNILRKVHFWFYSIVYDEYKCIFCWFSVDRRPLLAPSVIKIQLLDYGNLLRKLNDKKFAIRPCTFNFRHVLSVVTLILLDCTLLLFHYG